MPVSRLSPFVQGLMESTCIKAPLSDWHFPPLAIYFGPVLPASVPCILLVPVILTFGPSATVMAYHFVYLQFFRKAGHKLG